MSAFAQALAEARGGIANQVGAGLSAFRKFPDERRKLMDYVEGAGGRPPTSVLKKLPDAIGTLYNYSNWYGNAVANSIYQSQHGVPELLLAAHQIRGSLEDKQSLAELIAAEGARIFRRREYVQASGSKYLPSITSGLRQEAWGLAKKYGADYSDVVKLSEYLKRNDHYWFYAPYYGAFAKAHIGSIAGRVAEAAKLGGSEGVRKAYNYLVAAYMPKLARDKGLGSEAALLLGESIDNYRSIILMEKPVVSLRGVGAPLEYDIRALQSPALFARAGAMFLEGENQGRDKLLVQAWQDAIRDQETVANDILDDAVVGLLKTEARQRASATRLSAEEVKTRTSREIRKARAVKALLKNPDADISSLVGGDGQLRRAVMRLYETLSTMRDTVIDAREAQERADMEARSREADRILGVHTRAYAQEAADAITRPVRNDNRPLIEGGAGVLRQPEGVYCSMRRDYINTLRLDPSQRPQPGRYRNMAIMEPDGSKAKAVIDIDLSAALYRDLLESDVAYFVGEGTFDELPLTIRGEPLRGEQARRAEEFAVLQNQGRRIREAKAKGYVFKGIEGRLRDRMSFIASGKESEQMQELAGIYRRLLPEEVAEIRANKEAFLQKIRIELFAEREDFFALYEDIISDLKSTDPTVRAAAQVDAASLASKVSGEQQTVEDFKRVKEALDDHAAKLADPIPAGARWSWAMTYLLGTREYLDALPIDKIQLLAQAIGIVPVVGVNVTAPNTLKGKRRLALAVALTCAEETKGGYEVTLTPDVALLLADDLTDIGLDDEEPYAAEAEEAATALRMAVERAKAPKDSLGKDSAEGTFGTLGRKRDRYIGKTKLREQNVIVELDDEGLVKVPRDKHAARGLGCYD